MTPDRSSAALLRDRTRTSRRTFLALCAAVAGAAMMPTTLRLRALQAHAAIASWTGFDPVTERPVLIAAANTVAPGGMVNRRVSPSPLDVPSAGDAGTVDFIENLLSGRMIYAAGASRPPYVALPAGVSPATYFPSHSQFPMWFVKRLGWLGDPQTRPTRPFTWPSELERLRKIYTQGIVDLNNAAKTLCVTDPNTNVQVCVSTVPSGFADPAAAPLREPILRKMQFDETMVGNPSRGIPAYNGQGEGNQPFFLTFLDHLTEACFGDPIYGGNTDYRKNPPKPYIYWDMINFSGPSFINSGGPAPGQGWTWQDMTGQFDRNTSTQRRQF